MWSQKAPCLLLFQDLVQKNKLLIFVFLSPDNETEQEKQKRIEKKKESKKRPLDENNELSINKMKRLVKNPEKSFKPKPNKPVYIKCLTCGNPKVRQQHLRWGHV